MSVHGKFNKNNDLGKPKDMPKTRQRHQGSLSASQKDIIHIPKNVDVMSLASDCPERFLDYAELTEKQFASALADITDYEELSGLANRRKILNAPQLTRWSERQREQIIERKFELQKEKAK